MKKSSIQLYTYIFEGEKVAEFEVPNRHGPSNWPRFYAKCAINAVGSHSDEEGRYIWHDNVEIYCGKRPVTIISGRAESSEHKTNLFGNVVVEAADKTWAVFLPDNDSSVPGYAHVRSDGTLSLVYFESALFAAFGKNSGWRLFDDRVEFDVKASILHGSESTWSTAKLIVFANGEHEVRIGKEI